MRLPCNRQGPKSDRAYLSFFYLDSSLDFNTYPTIATVVAGFCRASFVSCRVRSKSTIFKSPASFPSHRTSLICRRPARKDHLAESSLTSRSSSLEARAASQIYGDCFIMSDEAIISVMELLIRPEIVGLGSLSPAATPIERFCRNFSNYILFR